MKEAKEKFDKESKDRWLTILTETRKNKEALKEKQRCAAERERNAEEKARAERRAKALEEQKHKLCWLKHEAEEQAR